MCRQGTESMLASLVKVMLPKYYWCKIIARILLSFGKTGTNKRTEYIWVRLQYCSVQYFIFHCYEYPAIPATYLAVCLSFQVIHHLYHRFRYTTGYTTLQTSYWYIFTSAYFHSKANTPRLSLIYSSFWHHGKN
jgi:hypothetical protein